MKRSCVYLALVACLLTSTSRSFGRQSGEAELVQSWFQKYLKRRADQPAVRQFVGQLHQGVPQIDIQGTILGSDEFFNRYGRRNEEFVRGLYLDALDRQAGPAEIRIWVGRLREVGGDRTELAKRFLRSAETEQVTGGLKPIDLVRLWYRKFLGREVDPSGIDRYVGLLRQGASALDCQAELLGSDEYYQRQGSNLNGFVAGLYGDVLGRAPTSRDLRSWQNTFNRLGGNRQILARQFLGQAGVQVENSQPPLPPPVQQPGYHRDLISQMVRRSEQLASTIQVEIPGTMQGRQCIIRCQSLQTAAMNLQSQIASNVPPNVLVSSLDGVERAYGALRARLAAPAGTAPNSEQIANQIGLIIVNLRSVPPFNGSVGGGPPIFPPAPPPPPNLGYDRRVVLNLVSASQGETQRLLDFMGGRTFLFQSMRRDIESFARQLDAIRQQAERGEPLPALQNRMSAIQRFGVAIGERLRHPSVPTLWQQKWVGIDHNQARLAIALNINPAVGGPPIGQGPGAILVGAIDYLVGEIDAYLASIAPLMAFNPAYFPLQAQLNAMRASVLEMRQLIEAGAAPNGYRPFFVQVQQQFLQIANVYNAILRGNPALPPPALTQISGRFDDVARAMPR